ncbi:hypothetical protein FO519_003194 [Halicephalobus sp. NKZ332]|nr:hypothetical protein FO519_003194 [Halicephalobus sp. NKZ332]
MVLGWMSQDLPQYELWQKCRDWLITVGALERNIDCNHLKELGAALKDGVRLCKLANILKEGCIEKSSIYVIISDSSVMDSIDEKIYDAVRYQNEDSEEAQIYDRIVVQREAVEDIWKSFKPECQREHQIKELLDTETNYLKNCLEMLMADFYTPLKHFISTHDFKTIFGNIADIYQIHQSFHSNLRRAVLITFGLEQRLTTEAETSIGSVFMRNKTAFLAYAEYCAHIKSARECLDELERKEPVTKRKISELTKRQDFSLQDLLSVPFQRICKYHLILKNIVESTDIRDPERLILQKAFEACADIVNYVNEVKRDYELMDVIISIERSIVGIEEHPDFKMYGRLQLDGYAKLADSKEVNAKPKQRYVFIFERVILICKKQKNSTYEFKSAYKMADYSLEDTVPDNGSPISIAKPTNTITRKWTQSFFDNTSITLIKLDKSGQTEHSLQIVLKSLQQREIWKKKILEAMEKNYPTIGRTRHHELSYTTFEDPTDCDVCHKLLLGKFYQGYKCMRCNRNFHFECLSTAYCRQRSSQSRISDPGFLSVQTFRNDRYVALQSVHSSDPNVLSFELGEEIIVHQENDDGTLFGRRTMLPGKSGIISKETVRQLSGQISQRESTASISNFDQFDNGRSTTLCSQKIIDVFSDVPTVESQPWYFGSKDRHQANELLSGKPDGTFIVRLSPKENKHVISVCYMAGCKHMKIEKVEFPGSTWKYYLHDGRLFSSIVELVEYHRKNSLAEGFDKIDTVLTRTLLKTRVYRVIHDYKHQSNENSKYLELRKGQIVQVLDTTGEENFWWRFQAGDRTGFFPLTFVAAVVDESENGA